MMLCTISDFFKEMRGVHFCGSRMQITVESEIKGSNKCFTVYSHRRTDSIFLEAERGKRACVFASACATADYRFSQSPRTYNQSIVPL